MNVLSPGDEAAVMDNAFLHIHSSFLLGPYRLPLMAPGECDRGVQVGGSALQRQPVPPEHQLPLRRDQLQQGQLQRGF